MASSDSFVLVTGISGYAGAHVVDDLVKEGYRVRGVVRSGKLVESQGACDAAYGKGRVEVVAVDDIATGDFTEALKDITAVIHVASPLPGSAEPAKVLAGAIEGTVRILRQGQKLGVKRFSVASSVGATVVWDSADASMVIKEDTWNVETKERAMEPGRTASFVYSVSKAEAEREVWKFAEEFPDTHVTVVCPPFIIGPNAPCQYIKPGEATALSTNLILYNFILPESKIRTNIFGFVDVKDVSGALVAGIRTPGKNRVLITGEWFEVKDAIDYILSVRPELKSRLINPEPTGQTKSMIVLNTGKLPGLKPMSSWKKNVLETIDFLVKVEKEWIDAGIDVDSTMGASCWKI